MAIVLQMYMNVCTVQAVRLGNMFFKNHGHVKMKALKVDINFQTGYLR